MPTITDVALGALLILAALGVFWVADQAVLLRRYWRRWARCKQAERHREIVEFIDRHALICHACRLRRASPDVNPAGTRGGVCEDCWKAGRSHIEAEEQWQ